MNTQIILTVIIGIPLILLGLIIPKYPKLLSGFNTLGKEKLESQEVKKAIRLMSRLLTFGGIIITTSAILSLFCDCISSIISYIIIFVAVILSCVSVFYLFKFTDKNKRDRLNVIVALSVTIIATVFIIGYFSTETKVKPEGQQIQINGIYGESIKYDDIEKIEIVNTLPKTIWRSNGYSLGNTRIGYFKNENNETVKFFIHSSTPPYLLISKKSGQKVYINFKDSGKTSMLYEEVIELFPR